MVRLEERNESAEKSSTDREARLRVIEATGPAQQRGDIEKLEIRIGQLERFRYTLAGGLSLLVIMMGVFGYYIGHVISSK